MATTTAELTRVLEDRVPIACKKIRVVHIIDRLVIGGPTKYAVFLAANLDRNDFEGHLISGVAAQGECDITDLAVEAGLQPIIVEELSREIGVQDFWAFIRIVKALFRLKPDVVHTHKSKAGVLGRTAATLYNWLTVSALWLKPKSCKIIHTFHGHVFHGYFDDRTTRFFLGVERFLGKFCTDRIITLSSKQRSEICDEYCVASAEKVVTIPLGIDLDKVGFLEGTLRTEYAISGEEIVVGAVGRLCEIKNFDLLLRAFALTLQEKTGRLLRLVIVGDGHLRESLERLVRQLGIGKSVIFTGFRQDLARVYPDFDVIALSSLNEGTPTTLIEGMAYGKALLSTDVGGVVDLMGAFRQEYPSYRVWEHGITVRSDDTNGFAEGLRALIADLPLRRQMGSVGRSFVRTYFHSDRLVADVQNLYSSLLSNSSYSRASYRQA